MSWDNPVSPLDAKNSIGFFGHFLASLDFWVIVIMQKLVKEQVKTQKFTNNPISSFG